jgi:8-oxo-dGTP pyrophosphatase MutT (NUDIX family)
MEQPAVARAPWEREGLTGAGVVPFALASDGKVVVLFHTKEVGKKVGYLVDFGGGLSSEHEPAVDAAVREVSEETGGVFDLSPEEIAQQPFASNRALQQSPLTTLAAQRLRPRLLTGVSRYLKNGAQSDDGVDRVWHGSTGEGGYEVFFVRVPYVSADQLNQLFASSDRRCRFQWVDLEALLPDSACPTSLPLHPRLVAIHGLPSIWTAIAGHHSCSHEP